MIDVLIGVCALLSGGCFWAIQARHGAGRLGRTWLDEDVQQALQSKLDRTDGVLAAVGLVFFLCALGLIAVRSPALP